MFLIQKLVNLKKDFLVILNISILPNLIKLAAGTFAARSKQASLDNKTNFVNQLTTFNTQITANKTKQLEVQ